MFGRTVTLIKTLIRELQSMTLNIADLKAELDHNSDVQSSASLLMRHLIAELQANKNDPAALDALIQKLKDNDTALAQSVADTSAADQPASEPSASAPTNEPLPAPEPVVASDDPAAPVDASQPAAPAE